MADTKEIVDIATLVMRGIELIAEIVREIDAAKEGLKSPSEALAAIDRMHASLAEKRAERDKELRERFDVP